MTRRQLPENNQRSLVQKVWQWTGFKEKKLWDILQLLIVPTALAVGAFYLQETSKQRDLQIAEENRQKDQQIADDRAKQEVLKQYFDDISVLLLERKLRTAREGSDARIVARAKTLTALRRLDGDRKGQLIQFLAEAKLIQGQSSVISLWNADLREINLENAKLVDVNFMKADLREANLRSTRVSDTTNFIGASLREADLSDMYSTYPYPRRRLPGVTISRRVENDFFFKDRRGYSVNADLCNAIMPDGERNNNCDIGEP